MSLKVPPHSIFFVLGPTGVGKSKFSLEAALRHKGQIINSDSLQVYQSVNIGTNQPSLESQKKLPHHLFAFVKEGTQYTAGEFHRTACQFIEREIQKTPLFVTGGSGFYVQALEKGMFPVEKVPEEILIRLKEELKQKGGSGLFEEVKKRDPFYAQKIHPKDHYRLLRSLSLMRSFEKKMSDIQKENLLNPLPFSFLKLALFLEKEELKRDLLERTKKMFQSHFLEEVKELLNRGLSHWPLLKSVGYKECVQFLNGDFSKDVLIEKILNRNLKLVKKQMTWFKRDSTIEWFHAKKEWQKALDYVDQKILKHKELFNLR